MQESITISEAVSDDVKESRSTFSVSAMIFSSVCIAVMTTYCSLEHDSDFMSFLYAGFNSL